MQRSLLFIALLGLSACATTMRMPGPTSVLGRSAPESIHLPTDQGGSVAKVTEEPPVTPDAAVKSSRVGDDAAKAAKFYLGHRPKGFRDDCSGFVCAVYNRAGIPLSGNTASLWGAAQSANATHHRKMPSLGDVAFFDNTYDRNHNGRLDDDLTHVAVVIEVHDDGTILLAHNGTSRGRTTLTMNLREPSVRRDDNDKTLNDYLRSKKSSDSKRTVYLAGELCRGFATPDRRWLNDIASSD
ncbi:MAG: CHAP domain-containing protein [Rhodobacterales bacterium]|nr:CHAP domain-containing protein [Rhodobacterales bacterium]